METKNLKSIEWHYDALGNNVRLRIVTKEINRARIFVINNAPNAKGYAMNIYSDWAELESSDYYTTLISVFVTIAEMLNCDFTELTGTMVEIDKLFA